jgi:hypothetical protein
MPALWLLAIFAVAAFGIGSEKGVEIATEDDIQELIDEYDHALIGFCLCLFLNPTM